MKVTAHGTILLLLARGFPEPVPEFRFAPPRRWRFDWAWIDARVAFEIEGGTWAKGRHTRGKGYEADCVKYSEAALRGWRVIRATTTMVQDGRALDLLERALAAANGQFPGSRAGS